MSQSFTQLRNQALDNQIVSKKVGREPKKFFTTKIEIKAWLDKYYISDYTITDDLRVNVNKFVNIAKRDLTFIPVRFGHIEGTFYCEDNLLTSLEFAPTSVAGDFYCSRNKLRSLKHCPAVVGGSFYCSANFLTGLRYFPAQVGQNFFCYDNPQLDEFQYLNDFSEIMILREKKLLEKELSMSSTKFKNISKI